MSAWCGCVECRMRVGQNAPNLCVRLPLPLRVTCFKMKHYTHGAPMRVYNKGSMIQAKALAHLETVCLTLGHVGRGTHGEG